MGVHFMKKKIPKWKMCTFLCKNDPLQDENMGDPASYFVMLSDRVQSFKQPNDFLIWLLLAQYHQPSAGFTMFS